MGCSFFKFGLTVTHTYCFRIQALHIHTLTLESTDYTAHSSDQHSTSTGSELHTALTTLKTVLTDVILAKWSAFIFAS